MSHTSEKSERCTVESVVTMSEPYVCPCCGEETNLVSGDCNYCHVTCNDECKKPTAIKEVFDDDK